jgi:hypothetical protein
LFVTSACLLGFRWAAARARSQTPAGSKG